MHRLILKTFKMSKGKIKILSPGKASYSENWLKGPLE
jgi:hypothetical protein